MPLCQFIALCSSKNKHFSLADGDELSMVVLTCWDMHGDVSFPYLIESFPMLLLCSENNHPKLLMELLEHIGIPKPEIATVLLLFPPVILSDVENDTKPRIREWEKVFLFRASHRPSGSAITQ